MIKLIRDAVGEAICYLTVPFVFIGMVIKYGYTDGLGFTWFYTDAIRKSIDELEDESIS